MQTSECPQIKMALLRGKSVWAGPTLLRTSQQAMLFLKCFCRWLGVHLCGIKRPGVLCASPGVAFFLTTFSILFPLPKKERSVFQAFPGPVPLSEKGCRLAKGETLHAPSPEETVAQFHVTLYRSIMLHRPYNTCVVTRIYKDVQSGGMVSGIPSIAFTAAPYLLHKERKITRSRRRMDACFQSLSSSSCISIMHASASVLKFGDASMQAS